MIAPRIAQDDVIELFNAHLQQFRENLQALQKHLDAHVKDLPAFAWHQLETLALGLDEAIVDAECSHELPGGNCTRLAVEGFHCEAFCQEHAELYTRCELCHDSLLRTLAYTDDDGRDFHPMCYGPNENTAYESAVGL